MAVSALRQPPSLPAGRPAVGPAVIARFPADLWKPAPLAPQPRRPLLNAAAHEAVIADLRLSAWLLLAACCIGAGLALGIHFDDVLHDLRRIALGS